MVRARDEALAAALPELDEGARSRLFDELLADAWAEQNLLEQRTDERMAAVLRACAPGLSDRVPAVRRALGREIGRRAETFAGCRELFVAARDRGLRSVIVSNTAWTSTADWWELIAPEVGLAELLDGVVTSYDAGYRKPHRAMFDSAVAIAGCAAEECLMIGNNEQKDVEPALALGMTAIRVAIQEPPTPTRAHHLVTSLAGVPELITNA
jgi:FMN phosphatase YigB (HAD superfamily)